jgi:hypothetical protein
VREQHCLSVHLTFLFHVALCAHVMTQVKLECGDKNTVLSVDEPSKCVYTMAFATPAVCRPEQVVELKKNLEAEYGGDEEPVKDAAAEAHARTHQEL